MWLKKYDREDNEFVYEFLGASEIPILKEDGIPTTAFCLRKYFRNNDGELTECIQNSLVYVLVESLLSVFVVIDSPIEKTIRELREFKKDVQSERLNAMLAPFSLGSVEEANETDLSASRSWIIPQESNLKEDTNGND